MSRLRGFQQLCLFLLIGGVPFSGALAQESPAISFQRRAGELAILDGARPIATYIYRDKEIPRPYFAHVHAPGGIRLTRQHPPVAGTDATDHALLHPGLWLAFGDLGGADCWRLKAPVVHERFVEEPRREAGRVSFAARNHYLAADGRTLVCHEDFRWSIQARPAGLLMLWDAEFRAGDLPFAFGDQEEMGLGVRLATPLTVKAGGTILNSRGGRNEKQVRGQTAEWSDYSGTVEGRQAGITLMPDPRNFRPSWYHARDYGLLVANPFGRKALTGGAASSVVVPKGESLRLRFGILLHAEPVGQPPDLAAAYRDYLHVVGIDSRLGQD